MRFNDYQAQANETAIYPGKGEFQGLTYAILGLANEAGEVAGKLKKIIRDGDGQLTPQNVEDLRKEAGDVLWYLAAIATELKVDLSEIADSNLIKLFDRKSRGVLGGSGDNR